MRTVKTPRDAKGPQALKLLKRTSSSVFNSRMPARSAKNMRHSHSLVSVRQIVRIDRQPWEERVANILQIVEDHRYGRANALYNALNEAEIAQQTAMKKTVEAETFSEEVQAANEEMRANAEEMRAANEEMRASAEEMRAANEEMRLVSEELDRMHSDVEQLSPIFSTSFSQPLQKIQGNAAEVLKTHGNNIDAKAQDQLQSVLNQAGTMEIMVKQLLKYWNVELKGKTLETTDLELIFTTALENLKDSIDTSKAVITHDPLPHAVVDPSQFTLLFECLLNYCLGLCKEKAPRIHIGVKDSDSSDIEMPEPKMENGWIISVTDNGSMIPQEEHQNIFRVFHPRPEKDETQSSSMDLAMAWRIVKRHGGNIWLDSSPKKGNIWRFTIPEYDQQPNADI